ncbi:nicotinamide-nucleotide amidase [Halorientalis persicus]|uniref:Nicotinamide-nucleotide amidase n=1 Tax=Halorientalis persicus TaxID=1367881 RepID=A0A1H8ENI2_9EURY|nr:CinA family protein [Halorientalis persicus]SEN20664.1 nicotinamide-nucleotide amidase [Halorientalis persicus]
MHEFGSDPPIEETVGDRLREADHTVAIAEGCTGGLVATLLTAAPGASDYLDRALVPYSYDSLRELLALDRELLDDHGVVSGPVTRDLARAVRDTAGTTWGLATAGVAGPEGGTSEKPVGTAFVAVAYAGEWGSSTSTASVDRYEIDGNRATVRERIARLALSELDDHVAERT